MYQCDEIHHRANWALLEMKFSSLIFSSNIHYSGVISSALSDKDLGFQVKDYSGLVTLGQEPEQMD